MAVYETCDVCGRKVVTYRMARVILDGRIVRLCTTCVETESDRIERPYAPRADQAATQPSTQRKVWY